jgi:mannose-6-phosphate isomerase-like protein (cupin superfamily)
MKNDFGNVYLSWKRARHQELEDGLVDRSILIDETSVMDEKPSFNLGVTVLRRGSASTMTGSKEEINREKFCMVMVGTIGVKQEGHLLSLGPFDCLYVPAGASCSMNETDNKEAVYFWVLAPPFSQNKGSNVTYPGRDAQVIRLSEVTPSVMFKQPPDQRTSYELMHGSNFIVGLVRRPPGAFGPLHTHDPPDCEEAYISIQGCLEITDIARVAHVLRPFDALYVPPYGGNSNRNIGEEDCVYAYVESPAIEVKEVPVSPKSTGIIP